MVEEIGGVNFFRIALGNISNNASVEQMKSVKIYLHEPGKFLFFSEQDKMPNNVKIDPLKLQLSKEASYVVMHVHTVGVNKNETLVFVNFSAQGASILKISVPISKRRS